MPVLDQQLKAIRSCLARHATGAASGPMLVAVSGGQDSTVLLWLLSEMLRRNELNAELLVGHVDHGLHANSSEAADHVGELAARLGHKLVSTPLENVRSSEDALRNARYEALVRMARDEAAAVILTAHHADDDVETVLFRMMRGTGPRGLAGIPEARPLARGVKVIRPLIRTRRASITALLEESGLPIFEDPTNQDLSYSRNQLRHELLPDLREELGERLELSLMELAQTARRANDILEAEAQTLLQTCARHPTPWRCEIERGAPSERELPFFEEALCQAYAGLHPGGQRPSLDFQRRMLALWGQPAGKRVHGPTSLLIERTRAGILLVHQRLAGEPPDQPIDLPVGAGAVFGTTEWKLRRRLCDRPPHPRQLQRASPTRALISATHAAEPWHLRSRRAGDRFWPLGAARDVDLRRFLQARHLPRFDRDRLPILVDGAGRILWIPGVEISAPHRITEKTSACFEVKLSIVGGVQGESGPY